MNFKKLTLAVVASSLLFSSFTGCTRRTQEGALLGGAGGAVVGGIAGGDAEGALTGAAVGAGLGATAAHLTDDRRRY